MPTVSIEPRKEVQGAVYCPMCTHTVSATVAIVRRSVAVKPGQRCPRCSSTLDAAAVIRTEKAA